VKAGPARETPGKRRGMAATWSRLQRRASRTGVQYGAGRDASHGSSTDFHQAHLDRYLDIAVSIEIRFDKNVIIFCICVILGFHKRAFA
jgi:hypothetical protein